jgi:hypothetical protein
MTVTGKIRKIQMREESAAKLGLTGSGHGPDKSRTDRS